MLEPTLLRDCGARDGDVTENHAVRNSASVFRRVNGLPMVCAWCQKIRNRNGEWQHVRRRHEDKQSGRSSHGMCPECARLLIRELDAAARVQHSTGPR
jgi:hypothetical protein